VRDAQGNPTGIMKDNAQDFVDKVEPAPPKELSDRALDAAMRYVVARA
jgi:predicted amidohydrolase YtcJ